MLTLYSVAEELNYEEDSQAIAIEAADDMYVPAAQPQEERRAARPSLRKMPAVQLAAAPAGQITYICTLP